MPGSFDCISQDILKLWISSKKVCVIYFNPQTLNLLGCVNSLWWLVVSFIIYQATACEANKSVLNFCFCSVKISNCLMFAIISSFWLFTYKIIKSWVALNLTMKAIQSICSPEIPQESFGKFGQKSWDCERATLLIGTNPQISRTTQFGNFALMENLTCVTSRTRISVGSWDGCQQ